MRWVGAIRTWPLWDVVFPPFCEVCGGPLPRDAVLFCPQCWVDAPIADLRDLRKLKHVDFAFAGFYFTSDNLIRRVVHGLKYGGEKRLAREAASHLLPRLPLRFVENDVVWTAVPLHWWRMATRGFNQSGLLAGHLAGATGHSPPIALLRRRRNTPTQTALTYRERAANMKDAFACRHRPTLPKRVLLIDDVITTGATMDECARTLKEAGVEWVGALAFGLAHSQ